MNVIPTRLPGLLILEPRMFRDDRGYFFETWNEVSYSRAGVPSSFVQDNLSYSRKGVLRGLHYQHPTAQGKLISVLQGEVFDVAVDIRQGSPTFGEWIGMVLSSENSRQCYIPPGFAHGFVVTSESAHFAYKCTAFYQPRDEMTIRWNDPELGIDWPIQAPLLSPKDAVAPTLREIESDRMPRMA